jgi:hypothetical protein
MQIAHATLRDVRPFADASRQLENDILAFIRGHLPDIGGVCFLNVHNIESHPILVLPI